MGVANGMKWLLVFLVAAMVGGALAENVPPRVALELERESAPAGAAVPGKVVVEFAPGLHGYQNPPTEEWMVPLTIEPKETNASTAIVRIDYPKGTTKVVAGAPSAVYSGRTEVPIVFRAPSRAGEHRLEVVVSYQQCDAENCFPPAEVEASALLRVTEGDGDTPVSSDGIGATAPPADLDASSPRPKDSAESAPPAAETREGLAGLIQTAFTEGNFWLIVPLLLLAGLVINLTPCIYPMIPITLAFFGSQAGDNRAKRFSLGAMYMVGIASMYGAVGGIAAASGATFGQLFAQPWFLVALSVLLVALALSMFDLYQIGIPPAIGKHLRGRSGLVGALVMGLLVGVAAAPCAGPVIVSIFALATQMPALLSILTFVLVGVGLGLPYLLLAAFATGAQTLPRAGGWMKTVKAILGLVVIGFALDFFLKAFPAWSRDNASAVWIAFYAASAAYLLLFDRSGETRAIAAIKGAAALAAGLMIGLQLAPRAGSAAELAWEKFTEEAFAAAKASGRPILIDATANWCAECQVIERRVFRNPETVRRLEGRVALLKIDWSTGVDPAYMKRTAELFDIKGLPHIIVMKPGGEVSAVLHSLESPEVLVDVLRRAGANL